MQGSRRQGRAHATQRVNTHNSNTGAASAEHALPKWSDGRRAPSARMRRAKKRPRSTHERRAADGRDVHTAAHPTQRVNTHKSNTGAASAKHALPKLSDGRRVRSREWTKRARSQTTRQKQRWGVFGARTHTPPERSDNSKTG